MMDFRNPSDQYDPEAHKKKHPAGCFVNAKNGLPRSL